LIIETQNIKRSYNSNLRNSFILYFFISIRTLEDKTIGKYERNWGVSAILPPNLVTLACDSFKIFKPILHRESCYRSNIKLEIMKFYKKEGAIKNLQKYLAIKIQDLKEIERIIIFVMRIDDCHLLEKLLLEEMKIKVSIFNSKMDQENVKLNVNNWRLGINKIMIATSGFGTGIDYPSVKYIIHFEGSYSLLSYYQEVGRGGRNGKPSEAICFGFNSKINEQFFQEIDEKKCLKKQILDVIDGEGGQSCGPCSRILEEEED